MPGPLSSERPAAESALTGGPETSVSHEINQDFNQVMRTRRMERPARLGTFAVNTASPLSRNVDQKTRRPTNLRTKGNFKRRKLRK